MNLTQMYSEVTEVTNHKLNYYVESNSPAVENTFFIVHGAATSAEFMADLGKKIIESLDNSRIIIVDVPLHGKSTSDLSAKEVSIEDYRVALDELIFELKREGVIIGKLNWIGWSMGGTLGFSQAAKTNTIDRLITICSMPVWNVLPIVIEQSGLGNPEISKVVAKAIIGESLKELVGVGDSAKAALEMFEELTPTAEVITNDFTGLTPDNVDLTGELKDISAEVIMFIAENDQLTNIDESKDAYDNLAKARLIELTGAGHAAVMDTYYIESIVESIKESL